MFRPAGGDVGDLKHAAARRCAWGVLRAGRAAACFIRLGRVPCHETDDRSAAL